MICDEIREKIAAYADGTLPEPDAASVRDHLASCSSCRTSLAELSRTIERLKALEEVTPPAWLKQRVMAKVREEARPTAGFLARLFGSRPLAMPLGAVATILVAGIALVLYHEAGREQVRTVLPEEKQKTVQGGEPAPQPQSTMPARPAEPLPEALPGKAERRAATSSGQTVEDDRYSPRYRERSVPAEPVKESAAGRPAAPGPASRDTLSVGAVEKQAAPPVRTGEQEAASAAAPAMKAAKAETARNETDVVQTLTLAAPDPEEAAVTVEKLLKEAGATDVRTETVQGHPSLTAVVPAGSSERLTGAMRKLGRVDGDIRADGRAAVPVRIRILPGH